MNPRSNTADCWVTPMSIEDWKQNRVSTKLDILLDIVAHHLEVDNAPPFRVAEDSQTLITTSVEHAAMGTRDDCNQIIIFSLFLSSNAAIQDVSISLLFPFHLFTFYTQGINVERHQSPRTQRANSSAQAQVRSA